LRLGQAGVSTLVLESHATLLPTTRAMVYMPVVIPVLRKLGVLDVVLQHAFLNQDGVVWRDLGGNQLARLPLSGSGQGEFGGVLLFGQSRMNALILEELKKYPCVEVRFGLRCVGIEDTSLSQTVTVMVHQRNLTDEDIILEADYVLGTDGANSSIRRMMCIPFEGFTFQEFKMIGCDVTYDFFSENDFTPLNFVVHPYDWAVIAYTGETTDGTSHGPGEPLWRVAYVEPPELPDSKEETLKRAQERVQRYFKGSKKFKISRAEPYWLHQRCAKQGRKGRVLLAGDALHSNNPIGGLGLTTGILDAFAYGNALSRVAQGEPDSLLTECAESRRNAWLETTNQLSQANMKRLYGFDEASIKGREGFFHLLNADPSFPAKVRAGFDKMLPETFEKQ